MSDIANPRRIRLERRSPSYWRVTFDHPPLNIFGPETIPQLNEVITALETNEHVKVVVFDSAAARLRARWRPASINDEERKRPHGPSGSISISDRLLGLMQPRRRLCVSWFLVGWFGRSVTASSAGGSVMAVQPVRTLRL